MQRVSKTSTTAPMARTATGESVEAAQKHEESKSSNGDRCFRTPQWALFGLTEINEVSLRKQLVHFLHRTFHKKRVAKGQLHIFKTLAKILTATVEGEDDDSQSADGIAIASSFFPPGSSPVR